MQSTMNYLMDIWWEWNDQYSFEYSSLKSFHNMNFISFAFVHSSYFSFHHGRPLFSFLFSYNNSNFCSAECIILAFLLRSAPSPCLFYFKTVLISSRFYCCWQTSHLSHSSCPNVLNSWNPCCYCLVLTITAAKILLWV